MITPIAVSTIALSRQATLSSSQILARSQKAYASVRTFEEDVRGTVGKFRATAHISFQRPGNLRVTGQTMFNSRYDLACHGADVWLLANGNWTKQRNAEMGIAAVTGISAQAAAQVPAALMHTAWAAMPTAQGASKLKSGSAKGRTVYRIDYIEPFPASYWFDGKSFFLIKAKQTIMGQITSIDCDPPVINKSIPLSRFLRAQ